LREQVAPWPLGRDAHGIEAVSRQLMTPYLSFDSSGAEICAASAVDIALWNLAGQRHGIQV
jgi:galactonate dehydratase